MQASGPVKVHSPLTILGQQGTKAYPERLGVSGLTRRPVRRPSPSVCRRGAPRPSSPHHARCAVTRDPYPVGTITAPANRHDSPLLNETLEVAALGGLPEGTSVHLDRGYDSGATRERLRERGLIAEISLPGGTACHARGDEAVGGGAHRLLVQRPQEAGVMHGAPGTGGGLLDGLLGRGRHSEAGASLSSKPAALVLAVARLARS